MGIMMEFSPFVGEGSPLPKHKASIMITVDAGVLVSENVILSSMNIIEFHGAEG